MDIPNVELARGQDNAQPDAMVNAKTKGMF